MVIKGSRVSRQTGRYLGEAQLGLITAGNQVGLNIQHRLRNGTTKTESITVSRAELLKWALGQVRASEITEAGGDDLGDRWNFYLKLGKVIR